MQPCHLGDERLHDGRCTLGTSTVTRTADRDGLSCCSLNVSRREPTAALGQSADQGGKGLKATHVTVKCGQQPDIGGPNWAGAQSRERF